MKTSRFLSLWVPVLLCMGVIYWLSSIPGLRITEGPLDFVLRKLAHVGEFGLLTILLIRANEGSWPEGLEKSHILWAVLIAVFYAASDEFHQRFVPHRGPSVKDVLIDSIGIGLAAFFWPYRPGFLRQKK